MKNFKKGHFLNESEVIKIAQRTDSVFETSKKQNALTKMSGISSYDRDTNG